MTNGGYTEEQIAGASRAFSEATRVARLSVTDLDLPGAVDELSSWLADDHEAGNLFGKHWATLLGDVLWTADQCGPLVTAALSSEAANAIDELKLCRSLLRRTQGPPDRALRRRMTNAASKLEDALTRPRLLVAAFHDVATAAGRDAATHAATLLLALCAQAGYDPDWFPGQLRSVLSDQALAIASARGEPVPDDPTASAGATPDERGSLIEQLFTEPPSRGKVIVWLRLSHAYLGWPPVLELGDAVVLFDDAWIGSALQSNVAQVATYAPELDSEFKLSDVRTFVGAPAVSRDQRDVIVRVVVGSATASEGRQVARRTAEAVAGLASLYGASPRLWELDDSDVVQAEDGSGGMRFRSSPGTTLDAEDLAAMASERIGRALAELAPVLGPNLPVKDPAIVHAATLLSWLRSARAASGAPRILLCDRVVEQVTRWAGFGDAASFCEEVLKHAWAVSRLRTAVANAAFEAIDQLRRLGSSELAAGFIDGTGQEEVIQLKQFLEALDDVLLVLGERTTEMRALRRLLPHVQTPASSAKWLEAEFSEFQRREARRRRTRNSLVHGGPLALRTVEATVEFAEAIAVHALADCIQGRLSGADLVDYFLEQRERRDAVHQLLRAGKPLSESLFW